MGYRSDREALRQRVELLEDVRPITNQAFEMAVDQLDEVEEYVGFYEPLPAPYPWPQFAVVEKFFTTADGLPSASSST